jgi:hypothetical protein
MPNLSVRLHLHVHFVEAVVMMKVACCSRGWAWGTKLGKRNKPSRQEGVHDRQG